MERQQDEISNALSDSAVANSRSLSKNGRITEKRTSSYTAGASFLLDQSKNVLSSLSFGIKLDMPLNPFTKFDIQKVYPLSWIDLTLSQKLILYRQEGFEEISQFSLRRKWNQTFQTTLANSLVWTNETGKFALRHALELTQALNSKKGFTYSLGANAKFTPTYYYNKYDTSVSYYQLLHKDWLYATWTVGADFIKENRFRDEKFAQIRVDVFFR